MPTPDRFSRNGFTYVKSCTYATDPATVADVKVGDTIHVEGLHLGRPASYTATVLSVARDDYGMYFSTEFEVAELRWSTQASTITDQITVAARA